MRARLSLTWPLLPRPSRTDAVREYTEIQHAFQTPLSTSDKTS
jgi:hypothetical protein